jgi:hypothetical protein
MEYLIAGLLVTIALFSWIFWPRKPIPRDDNRPRQICIHSKDEDGNDIILTKILED